MLSIMLIFIFILVVYFGTISLKLKKYNSEKRTDKITKPLSIIIKISPIVGIVIFSILFTFILKGKFLERVTHSILVFAIWMYATKFYQYILSYYKKKDILISSIIGMLFSVVLAIILTPLDRYVNMIYSYINWASIFLGLILYITFYIVTYDVQKNK